MASTDRSPRQPSRIEMTVNHHIVEVWLRRNIHMEVDEDGNDVWISDIVHGTLPANTTGAYVSAKFDALWDEWDDTPMHVRVADVRETADVNGDAIEELAEMVADSEVNMEDMAQAIMELAEIIGGE